MTEQMVSAEALRKIRDDLREWKDKDTTSLQPSIPSSVVMTAIINSIERILPPEVKRGQTATHPSWGEVTIVSNKVGSDRKVRVITDRADCPDGALVALVYLDTLTLKKEG